MSCIEELRLTTRRRSGWIRQNKVSRVPAWNTLRIDANDGSPIVEYRIVDGGVERRTVESCGQTCSVIEVQWQRLRPVELTFHIMANTVVAYWLSHRLGPHALAEACSQCTSSVNTERKSALMMDER